jgi:hypothetical protein
MRYLAQVEKQIAALADTIETKPAAEHAGAGVIGVLIIVARQLAIQNDLLAVRFGAAAGRETERAS